MTTPLIPWCFFLLLSCGSCGSVSGGVGAEKVVTTARADTSIDETHKESAFSKALIRPGTRILENPDWYIWDSSPIVGEDGKIHVFFSRWPDEFGNWLSHSEIAHAVADRPEGPYTVIGTVLKGRGGDYWDGSTVHNPTIHKVGNKYALFYNGNNLTHAERYDGTLPSTQRIGLAIADDLNGEFKRVGDEPLLTMEDGKWDSYMNNNPALLQHPNGQYWLYYKAWDRYNDKLRKIGVAFAEQLEGPYRKYDGNPILRFEKAQVEDPYVFYYNDKFYLIARDMGVIHPRVGLLVTSDDGLHWSEPQLAYHKSSYYFEEEPRRFERPQVLFLGGRPAYLFLSLKGGKYDKSTGVVLKIDPDKF